MNNQYLLYLAGICLIIFLLSLIQNKKEALMNFILRALFGVLAIYFLNKLFYHFGIQSDGICLRAGINLSTILISGVLGLPGILLIYLLVFFL